MTDLTPTTLWAPAPSQTSPETVAPFDGMLTFVVGGGGGVTVSVAGSVVAVPDPLVNTASYSYPFSDKVTLETVRVSLVAPDTGEKVDPPSVETCHCTVGAGLPLAAAESFASCPADTDWLVGLVVMDGATSGAFTI